MVKKMACPGCDRRDAEKALMAATIRELADSFASGAGSRLGSLIGGPRGALIGAEIAPDIIETGALAIADTVKRKRRQSKNQKRNGTNLSKALKEVNKKARKKDGSLRSGYNQRRIMQSAHKLARKMK